MLTAAKSNLTAEARAFLKRNPTEVGRVASHVFYECPDLGDESELLVILPNGKLGYSGFWEVPTAEELPDYS